MADRVVQLLDDAGDKIYPISTLPDGQAYINVTNVDPGEGSALQEDHYTAVYGSGANVPEFTLTNVDPGEGSALGEDEYIAVYGQPNYADLIDVFYPVGSYYETSDTSFNPNVAWGGTWVEDTAGRVLVAQESGTFATVGSTGGEKTHTLTETEMPSHSHSTYISGNGGGGWTGVAGSPSNQWAGWNNAYISSTGGNGAHNNLQPYIVIKRWHRTA